MTTVKANIIIPARAEEIFDYLADYRNIPKVQPHFTTARLVSERERGTGATVALEGRFRGLPMHATIRVIAYDRPSRMVNISEGSVLSRSTWELRPIPGETARTSVSLTVDYKVNTGGGGVLGGLANSVAHLFHGEIQHMTKDSLRRLNHLLTDGKDRRERPPSHEVS